MLQRSRDLRAMQEQPRGQVLSDVPGQVPRSQRGPEHCGREAGEVDIRGRGAGRAEPPGPRLPPLHHREQPPAQPRPASSPGLALIQERGRAVPPRGLRARVRQLPAAHTPGKLSLKAVIQAVTAVMSQGAGAEDEEEDDEEDGDFLEWARIIGER